MNTESLCAPAPIERSCLFHLAENAELVAYPYHRSIERVNNVAHSLAGDDSILPGSWRLACDLAANAGEAAGLTTREQEGFLFDRKTGLVAYLFHHPENGEVRLVFGGTSAGEYPGELLRRSFLNSDYSDRQWLANFQNAFTKSLPDSYRQARDLTACVLMEMDNREDFQSQRLEVSGHSKGGGEACFSALSQTEPLVALCFCSAELGHAALAGISESNRRVATDRITHYLIKGDPLPRIGKWCRTPRHLGKIIELPAIHGWSSPVSRHDKFTRHVHHYVEKNVQKRCSKNASNAPTKERLPGS
ncbi:MAG: hypothetical protein ACPG5T_06850 [Endozoicomonas sp.]